MEAILGTWLSLNDHMVKPILNVLNYVGPLGEQIERFVLPLHHLHPHRIHVKTTTNIITRGNGANGDEFGRRQLK